MYVSSPSIVNTQQSCRTRYWFSRLVKIEWKVCWSVFPDVFVTSDHLCELLLDG